MPLTQLNDKAFAASLAGVAFDMTDGSRTVNCMVTYPALQDKFPGLAIARCVEAFVANRNVIEAIASAKFDAGSLEHDGRIRVTTIPPQHLPLSTQSMSPHTETLRPNAMVPHSTGTAGRGHEQPLIAGAQFPLRAILASAAN